MTSFDFHIHTGLSGCAENTMSPRQILLQASKAGIDVISITDHNSSANVRTAMDLASEMRVTVVPGIEVSSAEEVHVIALFEEYPNLAEFQKIIDKNLPEADNPTDIFGYQLIYDCNDEIIDTDDRLRQIGTNLGLDIMLSEVKSLGGYCIPAHIYRNKFSLTSQLGFIAPGSGFDAVEIGASKWKKENFKLGMKIEGYPVITGSDAHFIEDVGRTFLKIETCGKIESPGQILTLIARLQPG